MATLLVFVDGIGLGTPGPHNPFDAVARDVLLPLAGRGDGAADGWTLEHIDATLGVAGVPQSATGTASILTGLNVAAMVGNHQWAFPGPTVRAIIEQHSILRRAREAGRRVAYLNAFTRERAERDADFRRGACTCAALAGGGPLRTLDDLESGRAALFDLTHELAIGFGIPVRPSTIEESAERVAFACSELDLALFELFLTDHAGHQSDGQWARREVVRTETFLRAMTKVLDPRRDTLIVASDHGNLEDLSTRGHTMNRVPALGWGRDAPEMIGSMRDVSHVGERVLAHVLASDAQVDG